MILQKEEELSRSRETLEKMKNLEREIEFNIYKIGKTTIACKNKNRLKSYIKNIY